MLAPIRHQTRRTVFLEVPDFMEISSNLWHLVWDALISFAARTPADISDLLASDPRIDTVNRSGLKLADAG